MKTSRQVLLVESYYGGSHAAFADGLRQHSRHTLKLLSLPALNWRWRTRTAALELFHLLPDASGYDLVFSTGLLDLADLKALWGHRGPPVLLYMHESQLTYPHPKDRNPDMNTALQDIKNCLVAELVVFNSEFHRNAFLSGVTHVVPKVPSTVPLHWVELISRKSTVIYPGIDDGMVLQRGAGARLPASSPERAHARGPRVLWSHRWEYDKRPRPFFHSLSVLADEQVPFELVVLGENPQARPTGFLRARERLGDRIVRWGFVQSRSEYRHWLSGSDVVVSTAIQENFGIAMVEAMAAGCIPLLPRRLAYPEVVPERFHSAVLYDHDSELTSRLRTILLQPEAAGAAVNGLAPEMQRYSWNSLIERYDDLMEQVISRHR